MPYPNIAIPTYADLEPQIVAWAAARELVHPDGKPLKATPLGQHSKTVEEIREAALELRKLRRTIALADRLVLMDLPDAAKAIIRSRKHRLAMEFGDIFVTLGLQAAMHGTTLESCKVEAGRLGNGYGSDWVRGKAGDPPCVWEHVGRWADMLRDSLENPRSMFRFDAPGEIGAIALCVEDCARIQLSLMGPECLALALAKISGRQGEVVDGVFVNAGAEQCSL